MSSWRQYGGIYKSESSNKFTIGSIVTDNVVERTAVGGEFRVEGNAVITGSLFVDKIGDSEIITSFVNNIFSIDLSVNNIAKINKLYIGNNNETNFLFGNNNGISINHEQPNALVDIKGNNSVVKFQSDTHEINNILGVNKENKGIMTGTTKKIDPTTSEEYYESYLTFFNSFSHDSNNFNNTATGNEIDARLVYSSLNGGSLRAEASSFKFADAKHKLFAYDAYENDNVYTGFALQVESAYNELSNTSAKFTSSLGQGLIIGGGASPNQYDLSNIKEFGYFGTVDRNDNILPFLVAERSDRNYSKKFHLGLNTYKPKTGDTLLDINGKVIINYGEVAYVTDNSIEPSNIIFHPDNRALDRKPYIALSGSPTNKNIPYIYNIGYTFNGGRDWNYSNLDVSNNESLNISASEIKLSNFIVDKNDSTGKKGLHFLVSNNNSFYYSNTFAGASIDELDISGVWSFFTVTGTNTNSPFFKSGSDFTNVSIFYINEFDDTGTTMKLRILFLELEEINGNTQQLNGIRYQRMYFIDFDSNDINKLKTNSLPNLSFNDMTIYTVDDEYIPTNINSIIVAEDIVDFNNNTETKNFFLVGNGIYKVDKNLEPISIDNNNTIPPHNIDKVYNSIYKYDDTYFIAVGVNIISITRDAGLTWTDTIVSDIPGITQINPVLNGVYILDDNIQSLNEVNETIYLGNIMIVGNNGLFIYSIDRGNTFIIVPNTTLDGSGTGERIYSETSDLLNIYIEDTSNMVIVRKIKNFIEGGSDVNAGQLGSFMIHYLTIPYLFNYKSVDVLDICGNVTVQGDLRINNGEIQTNGDVFNFVNRTEKILNMGANLDEANIGKDKNTMIKVKGNMLLSDNISLGYDVDRLISDEFKIDVSGNIRQQGCVYQF